MRWEKRNEIRRTDRTDRMETHKRAANKNATRSDCGGSAGTGLAHDASRARDYHGMDDEKDRGQRMKFACVFPGQGSQKVGMVKELYENVLEVKEIVDRACDILSFDLKTLMFEGHEDELKMTYNAQTALLIAGVAAYSLLKKQNFIPSFAAGHSLGEYSACVAAGALSFEDTLMLVRKRGELMHEASVKTPGIMAAFLGADREKARDVCEKASAYGIVEVANYNSPAQVVVSGETHAVEKAKEIALQNGVRKVIMLAVSAPFHCSLMKPAQVEFKNVLNGAAFHDAQIPVVQNVNAKATKDAEEIKENLAAQITLPVLWEDSIKTIINEGITAFVEPGCGKVLCGLIGSISKNTQCYHVEDGATLNKAIEHLKALQS